MTEDEKLKVGELLALGHSQRAVSKLTGVPKSTVGDYAKKLSGASESVTHHVPNARILLWDCETAPMLGYLWGLFKQNVGINQLEDHSYMLSWSAKWLGSDDVVGLSLANTKGYVAGSEDDSELIKPLKDLINSADIVVAHNQNGFDKKVFNTRLLVNGMTPPKPYKSVDTLQIAKKHFKFSSNKLDGIAMQLGLIQKIDTGGFKLWRGCTYGDEQSFKDMLEYNMQDVEVLEQVYLKLRAWDDRHPNVSHYTKQKGCPVCGSIHLFEYGYHETGVSRYPAYQCDDCGHVSRSRKKLDRTSEVINV